MKKPVKKSFIIKIILMVIAILFLVSLFLPDIPVILAALDAGHYTHIRIFHTNDIHGHTRENRMNKLMGMDKTGFLINKHRLENGNTIILDAGDTIWGTNEADLNDGKPMLEIFNYLGCTAMTVGNHEFDFGLEKTMEAFKAADFPILSCNLFYMGQLLFSPYTLVERGGIRLGIIGYSTLDTITRTKPEYVKDLTISDGLDTLAVIMPELKARCDFIIMLAHEHRENLKPVMDRYPEIGLVVMGHEHIALHRTLRYKKTHMAMAGSMSQYLGIIDMVFKEKKCIYIKGKLIRSIKRKDRDERIKGIVEGYYQKIYEKLNIKAGSAARDLTDFEAARFREVNLGNAITDAMREYLGTDMALQNGGGIRVNIPKGDITLYQIHEAFPFINYVIEVEMSGREIRTALEHGLKTYPSSWNGGFLQVSGLNYTFDAARPSGERLVNVYINGREIEDSHLYSVATNDYLFQGGDGYEVIKNAKLIYHSGLLIEDIFKEYLQKHKVIDSMIEGRITILNEPM